MAMIRAISGVKSEGEDDKVGKVYLDSSSQESWCEE